MSRPDERPAAAPAPLGAATAIVAGAAALTQGAIAVVVLWLVVGVFVMAGVEELVGALPTDVDMLGRASAGALFPIAAIGGFGEPLRIAAEWALRMRTARRLAATGGAMPSGSERLALAHGPVGILRVLCGVVCGLALLGLLVAAILWGTEGDAEYAVATLVALLVAAAFVWAFRALRGAQDAWDAWIVELRDAWPDWSRSDEPEAVRIARSRAEAATASRDDGRPVRSRPRGIAALDVGLGVATVVAYLVVIVGVWLRQACRQCEPVVYEPFGESVVDGVAAVGLALLVVVLALQVLRAVVGLLLEAGLEVHATRLARAGVLVPSAWLDRALLDVRALERVGRVVGVVAMLLVGATMMAGMSADFLGEPEESLAALRPLAVAGPWAVGVAVLALVLGTLGALAARRWRADVLTHLHRDPLAGRIPT